MNHIKYTQEETMFTLYSNNLKKIIDVTSNFKDIITDLETTKGTLNDVFLAITGKEIRA